MLAPFQPQNAGNLDDATQQLISSLQQQNPGMRVAGKFQKITRERRVRDGRWTCSGQSPLAGPDGQPLQEHDWLITLPGGSGSVISLVFVAPEKDFSRLRPTFEHMLKTFHLNQ